MNNEVMIAWRESLTLRNDHKMYEVMISVFELEFQHTDVNLLTTVTLLKACKIEIWSEYKPMMVDSDDTNFLDQFLSCPVSIQFVKKVSLSYAFTFIAVVHFLGETCNTVMIFANV